MNERVKGYLKLVLKAGISAILLYILILSINLEDFIVAGKRFPMWSLAPLTLIFIGTVFFGSLRWQVFLKGHDISQGIWKGVELYLVGYFFNNFLPSGVGGDVVRGWSAGKKSGKMFEVYASIAAERWAGVLASVFIGLVFLPIVRPPAFITIITVLMNLGFWAITVFFIFLNLEDFTRKIFSKLPFKIGDKISDFIGAVRHYRKDFRIMFDGFILSIIYQGSLIAFVWLIAIIAGVSSIPWTAYFVFVPIIWVVSMLPITFNAFGVREASFSYFFSLWGATHAQGLLVSLIFVGTSIIAGIIGGIIWGATGHSQKRKSDTSRDIRTQQ